MKEQLISFKTAKLAKEKGFSEDVKSYYDSEGEIFTRLYRAYQGKSYQVPTQSLLQKWLRERHNIEVNSESILTNRPSLKWGIYVKDLKSEPSYSIKYDNEDFVSYEDAIEKGLQEALKLIK